MLNGFIKIAAAVPEVAVADCTYNAAKIYEYARDAAYKGAKLIVFPQLSLTGVTCGDLFLQKNLTDAAQKVLAALAEKTTELDAVIVVGLPFEYQYRLYNCAAVLLRGHILGLVPQTYTDNNGVFSPAKDSVEQIGTQKIPFGAKQIFRCRQLGDFSFGIEIGADATAIVPTSAGLTMAGANIIINLACEPEIMGADMHRYGLCASQSARLMSTYMYVGAGKGESSGDNVYSGCCIIAEHGKILSYKKPFEDETLISDADVGACAALRLRAKLPQTQDYTVTYFDMTPTETKIQRVIPSDPFFADDKQCEEILNIQAMGLKRRLEHIHAESAVIGISGGLDSTLALLVAVRAMDMMKKDHRNIIALTMPCFGTSDRTKTNAVRLCEKLGVTLLTVDIKKSVLTHFEDIGHDPKKADVVFENAQARERTQILMDVANAHSGIVIGTGDLSELALGFATYNGDHMSMYGVNASLPKTLIRTVTTYCANTMGGDVGKILQDIVDTPVSPELLPPENGAISQKTEEIVGAYELHDFLIYYMVYYGFSPKKIYRMACRSFEGKHEPCEILRCMKTLYRRFFAQQYKRSCLPDGPQVTPVSFSPRTSWHMPSDASGALWLKEIENIQ